MKRLDAGPNGTTASPSLGFVPRVNLGCVRWVNNRCTCQAPAKVRCPTTLDARRVCLLPASLEEEDQDRLLGGVGTRAWALLTVKERFPRPDCSGSRCTFIAAAIKPGKAKCSHVEKSAGFTVPWWLSRPSGSLLRSALRVRTLVRRPRLRRKVHRVRAFGSVGASFAKCCRRRRGVSAESATRP